MTYNCEHTAPARLGNLQETPPCLWDIAMAYREWVVAEIIAGRHWTLKCGLNERIRNADYRKGNPDNIKD